MRPRTLRLETQTLRLLSPLLLETIEDPDTIEDLEINETIVEFDLETLRP